MVMARTDQSQFTYGLLDLASALLDVMCSQTDSPS